MGAKAQGQPGPLQAPRAHVALTGLAAAGSLVSEAGPAECGLRCLHLLPSAAPPPERGLGQLRKGGGTGGTGALLPEAAACSSRGVSQGGGSGIFWSRE